MRGEYLDGMDSGFDGLELPPRARRILFSPSSYQASGGTTSACAENTEHIEQNNIGGGNYLRVRGEYLPTLNKRIEHLELPPRARRIPSRSKHDTRTHGTTSACAENTKLLLELADHRGNYLRVRGEYAAHMETLCKEPELPPRARRIPHDTVQKTRKEGTTSACAENTLNELGLL